MDKADSLENGSIRRPNGRHFPNQSNKYVVAPGLTLRVAISGKSGSGNTTVSTIVSQALGIPLVNYTFRQLAAERGMTLAQVVEAARGDVRYDKYIDTHQVELARKGSCVLASRLAIWMLHEADIKVYLTADIDTRAARIQKREGDSPEATRAFTQMRDNSDTARYKALYGIDNTDTSAADLVIDTTKVDAQGVAEQILQEMARRSLVRHCDFATLRNP